ncbi:MAG: hypothetical protein M3P18_03260 [Actinomycetota bacterium]|nr:hypothetical protein [Actinomycetota bacterium]
MAERLVSSPKTVSNHIEHIYASTRAGAGLFARRHGLLPEEELVRGAGRRLTPSKMGRMPHDNPPGRA